MKSNKILIFAGILLVAVILTTAAFARLEQAHKLDVTHKELSSAIPSYMAVKAVPESVKDVNALELPGNIEPIQNVPVYARASGFLERRLVDIGDVVKQGQLLAVISTPEIDKQVQAGKANLLVAKANLEGAISDKANINAQIFAADAGIEKAKSNYRYSYIEAGRYQRLAVQGALSYEIRDQAVKAFETDEAQIQVATKSKQALVAQLKSAEAKIIANQQLIKAAEANVQQVETLKHFQNVTAPCSGVITERLVDAGALVAAGGSTGTTQLLTMADTSRLRIFVDAPQSDYKNVHIGETVKIAVQEFPHELFCGKVTNIAGALNNLSRTKKIEVQINNESGDLQPGAFASVQFSNSHALPEISIPANAAITKDDGLYVAIVDNGKVHFSKVVVHRDHGGSLSIASGVGKDAMVLLDVPADLTEGTRVNVKLSNSG